MKEKKRNLTSKAKTKKLKLEFEKFYEKTTINRTKTTTKGR